MPYGDGTGPEGMGPLTGRGLGFCNGFDSPGFANPGPGFRGGRGWGRGWGQGRGLGWRNRFRGGNRPAWNRRNWNPGSSPQPVAVEQPEFNARQEMNWLKAQAKSMEKSLGEIRDRIEELEAELSSEKKS